MSSAWPWLALFGLGAFHGINPGMGWLFAVALGLQEQQRSAVWSALPPIAVGTCALSRADCCARRAHACQHQLRNVRWLAALALLALGSIDLFARGTHDGWACASAFGDLTLWSFLMASAHGAGLMLVPVFLGSGQHVSAINTDTAHAHSGHGTDLDLLNSPWLATLCRPRSHSRPSLVAGLVAFIVYEKLGVRFSGAPGSTLISPGPWPLSFPGWSTALI